MLWDSAARELGNALSRYNGMTNSVKLDSVSEVITCDLFHGRSYRYAYEVIAEFKKHVGGDRSAEVYLQHAILFGFLHSPALGLQASRQGVSRRINKTSHIALTPLGRACRAAKHQILGDDYERFLWEYALLECDFDLYGLFMSMSADNDGKIVEQSNLYLSFYQLCEKKLSWLKEKFPNKSQRTHIQRHVSWIGEKQGKKSSKKTGKPIVPRTLIPSVLENHVPFSKTTEGHHFFQRRKWARIWRHLDENGCITREGRRFVACLPSRSESLPFFWLAPSMEYVKARIISDNDIPQDNSFSPAWNLLRPKEKAKSHESFVDVVADYMKEAFDDIRMGHFKQAPLSAVVPYIYFLERESNMRIEEHALFRAILEKNRGQLSCLLHPDISRCHYRKSSI